MRAVVFAVAHIDGVVGRAVAAPHLLRAAVHREQQIALLVAHQVGGLVVAQQRRVIADTAILADEREAIRFGRLVVPPALTFPVDHDSRVGARIACVGVAECDRAGSQSRIAVVPLREIECDHEVLDAAAGESETEQRSHRSAAPVLRPFGQTIVGMRDRVAAVGIAAGSNHLVDGVDGQWRVARSPGQVVKRQDERELDVGRLVRCVVPRAGDREGAVRAVVGDDGAAGPVVEQHLAIALREDRRDGILRHVDGLQVGKKTRRRHPWEGARVDRRGERERRRDELTRRQDAELRAVDEVPGKLPGIGTGDARISLRRVWRAMLDGIGQRGKVIAGEAARPAFDRLVPVVIANGLVAGQGGEAGDVRGVDFAEIGEPRQLAVDDLAERQTVYVEAAIVEAAWRALAAQTDDEFVAEIAACLEVVLRLGADRQRQIPRVAEGLHDEAVLPTLAAISAVAVGVRAAGIIRVEAHKCA